MIEGVDCSEYQGAPNWTKVADYGIRFAYLRATYGLQHRDPSFIQNRRGAADNGVIAGAYHFGLFGNPEEEAREFWRVSEMLGANQFELSPALDLEAQPPAGWNKVQLMKWVEAFLDKIEALSGRIPTLYTGPNYWKEHCLPEEVFARYPLWIAQYSKTGPWHPTPTDRPTVPRPWPRWTMWQYSGNGGIRVPGIAGDVDRVLFDGTWEELLLFSGVETAPPPVCA